MTDKHAWVLFAAAKLGSLHENSADGAAVIAAKCADALLKEMQSRDLEDSPQVEVTWNGESDVVCASVDFHACANESDALRVVVENMP